MTTIDYIPAAVPEERRENYLNVSQHDQVVAADARPQAHRDPLPDHDLVVLPGRRAHGHPRAPRAAHARGRPHAGGDLQQGLHHARGLHGVLLPDPVGPRDARQLPPPADARGARRRLPPAQPAELVLPRRRRHLRCSSPPPWAASTPAGRSTPPTPASSPTRQVALAVVGIFINGFSSILTGLNFVVTIHKMRCPGLTWFRLPLFIWSIYATSLIQILGTPVVAITLALTGVERLTQLRHLRPGPRRRPGAVPAHVLVLQPPGRLHHDPARVRA